MKTTETNTIVLYDLIQDDGCSLFKLQNSTLILHHIFNGTLATPQQREHMLDYRGLGDKRLTEHIETVIIASSKAVTDSDKKRKLLRVLTFDKKTNTKQTQKQQIFHMKHSNKMLKPRIDWADKNKDVVGKLDCIIGMPMALADPSGLPFKGQKRVTRDFWYSQCREAFQTGELPQIICDVTILIIDAMFILYTKPTDQTTFEAFAHH